MNRWSELNVAYQTPTEDAIAILLGQLATPQKNVSIGWGRARPTAFCIKENGSVACPSLSSLESSPNLPTQLSY